jgi:hypothetical protein
MDITDVATIMNFFNTQADNVESRTNPNLMHSLKSIDGLLCV